MLIVQFIMIKLHALMSHVNGFIMLHGIHILKQYPAIPVDMIFSSDNVMLIIVVLLVIQQQKNFVQLLMVKKSVVKLE